MANFCPKCGQNINPEDIFCKSCGANLTVQNKTPEAQPSPQETPVTGKIPTKYVIRDVIKACIQIVLLCLFLYWIWYSYNCAVGNYPNTGDQMCKSLYQTFSNNGGGGGGGGGGQTTNIGCQHCSVGNCWTENHCCPNSSQYYCNGYCYRTSNEAYNAGCHQSSWTRWCCY